MLVRDAHRLSSVGVGIGGGINQETNEHVRGVVLETHAADDTIFFYVFESTAEARRFAQGVLDACDDYDKGGTYDE